MSEFTVTVRFDAKSDQYADHLHIELAGLAQDFDGIRLVESSITPKPDPYYGADET